MCIWVSVYGYAYVSSGVCGSQKRVLDLLGLELQVVVCCPTNNLWASAGIARVGGHTGNCTKRLREVGVEGSHLCFTHRHWWQAPPIYRQNCHLALLCKLRGMLTRIHWAAGEATALLIRQLVLSQ